MIEFIPIFKAALIGAQSLGQLIILSTIYFSNQQLTIPSYFAISCKDKADVICGLS
jgi:hypothetical protein